MLLGRAGTIAAIVLTLIAAAVLLISIGGTALLGWDTYPILLTSRVASPGDAIDLFSERLMVDLYPSDFYRPVFNLTIALDTALWGRQPFGFHLTNVLLFAAAALALYGLMRRLLGPRAWLGPLAALLFFLLHPTHIEVLPVPPRRPEILCALFMLLSLATQLSPRALAGRRLPLLPALFSLLAFLSKETSFVLPGLSFLVVLLCAPLPALTQRARRAGWALLPHLGAFVLVMLARMLVLGGLGGHSTTDFAGAFDRFPHYFAHMAQLLVAPQGPLQTTSLMTWLVILLAVALLASAVLSRRGRPAAARRPKTARAKQTRPSGAQQTRPSDAQQTGPLGAQQAGLSGAEAVHPLRTGLLGLAWLTLIGLSYAIVAEMSPWYMLLPVVGLGVTVGATIEGLFQEVHSEPGISRYAAAPAMLLMVVLLTWLAVYSPLIHRYPEWRQATRVSENFLGRLRVLLEQTPDGTVLEGPPLPTWVRPARGEEMSPRVFGAAIFSTYSIEAWARMEFPGRRIPVTSAPTIEGAQAAPNEVLLVFTTRMAGY